MDEDRYWELITLLEGVADDESVARLEAALTEQEAEAFEDLTDELVDGLLSACSVPPSHHGDTAEWIAAAVIAAGREVYQRTRREAAALDPDAWEWGEAERLLVAGAREVGEESPGSAHGFGLTWLAADGPSGWPAPEPILTDAELGIEEDDLSYGFRPFDDPHWDLAWHQLQRDEDLLRRIAALQAASLQVAVADVEEAQLVVDAEERRARLKVPVGWVLSHEWRTEPYGVAVRTLVELLEAGDA